MEDETMADQSLYERLGGVFAIAAVVDHFSDAVVKNAIAGQGSQKPRPAGMAYREARPIAGPEVHANPVGVPRRWWPIRVRRHQTRTRPDRDDRDTIR